MVAGQENTITLYPSNWLYNAGVIGLLRVLEFGKKSIILDNNNLALKSDYFKNFEIYYFEYALKVFLRDEFSFQETKKIFKEEKISISNIENDFRKDIDNLKANDDFEAFLNDIGNIFNNYKNQLNTLGCEKGLKKQKIEKGLKEDFDNTFSKIKGLLSKSYFPFLAKFYFNKDSIGNPSCKRGIENFREKYIDKVLEIIYKPPNGIYSCFFCSKTFPETYLSEFTEENFSPLGVSAKKFVNLFYHYNGKVYNIKKCPVCELILLCAFAGFNKKPWQVTDIEKTDYIFINLPNIIDCFHVNNRFATELKNYQLGIISDNIYHKGMEVVLSTLKGKSRWILENILFVEINPTYGKQQRKPKFTYFNIDRAFAEIFTSEVRRDIDNFLRGLAFYYNLGTTPETSFYLSTEVVKRILNKKPLKQITFKYFSDYLNMDREDIFPVWALTAIEYLFNQKRKQIKGGDKMDIKTIYGILKGIRDAGSESFTIEEIDKEKRYHIAHRFLSLIRGGRKDEFYNELLRLYVVYKKQIPEKVFSLLSEDDFLTFQEKALAFLTGFVEPKEGSVK